MAYLITHFWPGATIDQYDATVAVMHNPWPEGQLYHAAGPTDGGVLIAAVWDTKDHFDRFLRDSGKPIDGGLTGQRFCRAFPDNKVKHPCDLLFGEDDCTSFVTRFTGTFTGPLELPDGTIIQPTGKSFDVFFSTTARWRNGGIVEEYLKYDNASFMQQIGLA